MAIILLFKKKLRYNTNSKRHRLQHPSSCCHHLNISMDASSWNKYHTWIIIYGTERWNPAYCVWAEQEVKQQKIHNCCYTIAIEWSNTYHNDGTLLSWSKYSGIQDINGDRHWIDVFAINDIFISNDLCWTFFVTWTCQSMIGSTLYQRQQHCEKISLWHHETWGSTKIIKTFHHKKISSQDWTSPILRFCEICVVCSQSSSGPIVPTRLSSACFQFVILTLYGTDKKWKIYEDAWFVRWQVSCQPGYKWFISTVYMIVVLVMWEFSVKE